MTPREFVWLRERHQQEREYKELLVGITTATLANHSVNAPKKAYKPFDFMPSHMRKKVKGQVLESGEQWSREGFAQQMIKMREGFNKSLQTKGLFVVKGTQEAETNRHHVTINTETNTEE